ncbi:MAG: hypothetical protein IPK82_19710 [Polyangiaceae bacterium]|nr:hypothetical protein [Polyangiaceae bacterium]
MSEHKLGRDVFIALAAIGWSDGHLDSDEADAIVRTAMEEGLELDELAEIDQATKQRTDLSVIDRSEMTKADRLFVYAVASWMTRLDGVVEEGEQKALDQLGDLLKIPKAPREHADAIAQEIAELPEGDRPDRYDLKTLRTTINTRLEEAHRARLAMQEASAAEGNEGAEGVDSGEKQA